MLRHIPHPPPVPLGARIHNSPCLRIAGCDGQGRPRSRFPHTIPCQSNVHKGLPDIDQPGQAEASHNPQRSQHPTLTDHQPPRHLPTGTPAFFHGTHNVRALQHLPKHHVLPVQPRDGSGGDEELGHVGVRPSIRHGQAIRGIVGELEVFVAKRLALVVDALATRA